METFDRTQVNEMIRKKQGERSLRSFATAIGLSAAYLSDVLRGNREPGPKLLSLLKLKRLRTTVYAWANSQEI
jgi:transcriptional regulator with XRE-family HTH domain